MTKTTRIRLHLYACVAVLVAGYSLLWAWPKSEEELSQQLYCEQVADGNWPDYEGSYATSCLSEESR